MTRHRLSVSPLPALALILAATLFAAEPLASQGPDGDGFTYKKGPPWIVTKTIIKLGKEIRVQQTAWVTTVFFRGRYVKEFTEMTDPIEIRRAVQIRFRITLQSSRTSAVERRASSLVSFLPTASPRSYGGGFFDPGPVVSQRAPLASATEPCEQGPDGPTLCVDMGPWDTEWQDNLRRFTDARTLEDLERDYGWMHSILAAAHSDAATQDALRASTLRFRRELIRVLNGIQAAPPVDDDSQRQDAIALIRHWTDVSVLVSMLIGAYREWDSHQF